MHPTTQQVIDRFAGGLADDVPAGHFQSAENAHDRHIGTQCIAGAVSVAPKPFNVVRILTVEYAGEHILCHFGNEMRAECGIVNLADADNPAGRFKLDKDEIPATARRWRIGDDIGSDGLEFHVFACSVER